jgi:hypothetical protein
MAQSALTVTTPNPTPPTNMSFTGATPPNVPNYTKLTYRTDVQADVGTCAEARYRSAGFPRPGIAW